MSRHDYQRHYMRVVRQKKRSAAAVNNFYSSSEEDAPQIHAPGRSSRRNVIAQPVQEIPNERAGIQNAFNDMPYDDQQNSDSDGWTWPQIDAHVPLPSSNSEDETKMRDADLQSELIKWAIEYNVSHRQIDSLLKILNKRGHSGLPLTARTLLKTATDIQETDQSGMKYIFLGVRSQLQKHLSYYPCDYIENGAKVEISFNLDGLPIFKSSASSLWPFLCCIHIEPQVVFPVALTYGQSKPTDLEFLNESISEIKEVLEHGVQVKDATVHCKLRAVICDAPAKSFAKAIKQFNGHYGCDRCDQKGDHRNGRMLFHKVDNLHMRTDESFRLQQQPPHHKGVTPFLELDMDMISCFPLDYMHLLCLGVMKKLLLAWVKGPRPTRISRGQVQQISGALLHLQPFVPNFFGRKPRGLGDIERWKATEYRQFLLYTGKVVLKEILRPDLYQHFLALSIACAILVCPALIESHILFAEELLKFFVKEAQRLYGEEIMVYNVHSLLHLSQDAQTYGGLDNVSAFAFENHLQILKRMVRSTRSPAMQIARRISEIPDQEYVKRPSQIGLKRPDNAYIIEGDMCCEVRRITDEKDENGENLIMCRVYPNPEALNRTPWDSRIIGAFKVTWRNSYMKLVRQSALHRRAMMIDKGNNSCVFLAVLHTI